MPFSRPTLADLVSQITSDIKSNLDGSSAWLRRTAEKANLRRWASIWGVKAKPAWPASGNYTFTGEIGSVIEKDTVLQRADAFEYITLAETELEATTGTVAIEAVVGGVSGNLAEGATLSLVSPISGVQTSGVVAAGGLTQGSDEEKDPSLLARLLDRIQSPPHGGNKDDYETWTKDKDAHGIDVTRAWPVPLELGLGTVTVRFMMDNTYGDGIPQPADVAAVAAYIESERPVTADVTVLAPVAKPLNYNISGLVPGDAATKAAIEAELRDLHRREAVPGGTLLITHIREAISISAGEYDHTLVAPTENEVADIGEISTFGTITWSS